MTEVLVVVDHVDGAVRKTIAADYVPESAMYLVLSNGVSSVFGPSGEPDEATVFPNSFSIDYVRVYQAPGMGPVALNEKMPVVPDVVEKVSEPDPEDPEDSEDAEPVP